MDKKIKPWAGPPRGVDTDFEEYRRDVLQANCPHPMSRMSYEATHLEEFGTYRLETAEFMCGRCDKVWTVEEFRKEFHDELAALENAPQLRKG